LKVSGQQVAKNKALKTNGKKEISSCKQVAKKNTLKITEIEQSQKLGKRNCLKRKKQNRLTSRKTKENTD